MKGLVTQPDKKSVQGFEVKKFDSDSESDDELKEKVLHGKMKKKSSHRCCGGACVIQ